MEVYQNEIIKSINHSEKLQLVKYPIADQSCNQVGKALDCFHPTLGTKARNWGSHKIETGASPVHRDNTQYFSGLYSS